jgi:hypothetical protein
MQAGVRTFVVESIPTAVQNERPARHMGYIADLLSRPAGQEPGEVVSRPDPCTAGDAWTRQSAERRKVPLTPINHSLVKAVRARRRTRWLLVRVNARELFHDLTVDLDISEK